MAALLVRRLSSRVVIYFCVSAALVAVFAGTGPKFAATSADMAVATLFILGVFVVAVTSSIFAIAANAYPTALRSIGIGSALAFGRLGAIGSSFLGAAVSGASSGSRISFLVAAGLLAAQAIAMLFLTRHVTAVAGMKAGVPPAAT
jgi:AAHS family 4-hydroxybenzoate transporter-like MFS transporter